MLTMNWEGSRTLCKNRWLSGMMGRWTFCYIWFQLLAAHINFMKGKKKNNIGRFQGNECVKPSWSVWPWDVAGNPKRCRNISQMQRHFRGHSVAFLEAQMVKKSI